MTTPALTFTVPLLGLDPITARPLCAVAGAIGLHRLDTDGGRRLYLIEPEHYLPHYAPIFDAEMLELVRASTREEVHVLVIVSVADEGVTANLLAPIIVNPATGAACQVILDGQAWPVREMLRAA